MPDEIKISQLPPLSLPVTGAERIPFVQSGTTKVGLLSSLNTYLSSTFTTNDTFNTFVTTDPRLTTVQSSSANWNNTFSTVRSLSSGWQSNYTNVQSSSANWNSTAASVRALSSGWQSNYTNVQSSSANWNNTYSNVVSLSSGWQNASTAVQLSSANWNNTFSTVRSLSSGWQSNYTTVQASSANWNSAFTDTTNATSLPTANTLVRRDSSGSAGFSTLSASNVIATTSLTVASPTLGPQFNVNGAGTVTIGSWQGSAIGVNFGGTGSVTVSGARVNLGVPYERSGVTSILATGSGNINISVGSSIIASGFSNSIISGAYNIILGGGNNTASSNYSIVVGGDQNTVSASYSTIIGGSSNAVFGQYGTVLGGSGSFCNGSYAMVGNGLNNFAGGSFSVICGGSSNISSGTASFIGNGISNTSSGIQSLVGGGTSNTASGTNSTVLGGANGVASLFGEDARSSGRFTADGDAQVRRFILRNRTSQFLTPVNLFLDGFSSQLVIPSNTTWLYEIRVVGRSVQSVNSASFVFQGMIERSPLATTLLGATRNTIATDWSTAFNPNLSVSSNGTVSITAAQDLLQTGEVYWVAYAEIVQVTVPGTVPSYS